MRLYCCALLRYWSVLSQLLSKTLFRGRAKRRSLRDPRPLRLPRHGRPVRRVRERRPAGLADGGRAPRDARPLLRRRHRPGRWPGHHVDVAADPRVLRQAGRDGRQVRPAGCDELPEEEHRRLEHWQHPAGLYRRDPQLVSDDTFILQPRSAKVTFCIYNSPPISTIFSCTLYHFFPFVLNFVP